MEGSVQKGQGHENSDTITQRNTTVNGQTVNLRSGEDTTLKGAVVTGDKVNVEVGNNLVIESQQDTQRYDSKQKQAGASGLAVTGSGSQVSVNANLNKETGLCSSRNTKWNPSRYSRLKCQCGRQYPLKAQWLKAKQARKTINLQQAV